MIRTPEAYSKVIDRLLSSNHYGERWGRYWLDVVRGILTPAGDNSDFPIPQNYLYRNWVIDALNRDLPYDQFVREQLAGDLLNSESFEEKRQRIIATGYIAKTLGGLVRVWMIIRSILRSKTPSITLVERFWRRRSIVLAATIINLIQSLPKTITRCMGFSIALVIHGQESSWNSVKGLL